jgi:hypothetical protein
MADAAQARMHRAMIVDDAHSRLVHRYVQSAKEFHRSPPALLHRRRFCRRVARDRQLTRSRRTVLLLGEALAPITGGNRSSGVFRGPRSIAPNLALTRGNAASPRLREELRKEADGF